MRIPRRVAQGGLQSVLLLVLCAYWFPVLWIFLTSIRDIADTLAWPPVFIFSPTLDHFRAVIYESDFGHALLNSLVVGVVSTATMLLLGVPAAYGLARLHLRKREDLSFYIISTKMTPPIVVLFAYFIVLSRMSLLNTRFSLILLHMAVNLPLAVWLLRGFFEGIPKEIDEAAEIDGCTTFRVMTRIAVPICLTGIVVTATLCFMFSWMEFLFAATVSGRESATVPVIVYRWMSYTQIDWGALSAAGVLYSIPMFVLTFLLRNHLVRGITFGLYR